MKPSYRIYFTNFGYYSASEAYTLEGARKIAQKAGFQCQIVRETPGFEGCQGEQTTVATYCPLGGWHDIDPRVLGEEEP